MRVAVTGSGGRLGSALVAALARQAPLARVVSVESWSRPALQLDQPETLAALVHERRPDLVFHAAAWTDVDGCAREPELAMRRNAEATAALAEACRSGGADLLYVSTNEVFDGRRTDGQPYVEDDPVAPANPYGASKRAGEEAVLAAYGDASTVGRDWIVRTAWLYGPPGADFGAKVLAGVAEAQRSGAPLRLVFDEIGSPTRAADLAAGIVDLVRAQPTAGVYHLVNSGRASRAEWAAAVLDGVGLRVVTERVPGSTWRRASTPPVWGVLGTGRAAELGIILRDWRAALFDELPRYRALAAGLQADGMAR
ncbi:MAG: SDR family oxidoreductase [Candidatus Limnocylindrales bacterium]